MNWQNYITADPFVCKGKACFKDTQLMVSMVLEDLAKGLTSDEILKNYPSLNQEAIQAALAFVAEITREQIFNELNLAPHREVRVAGRLEAVRLSDYTFTLITAEIQYPINGFAKAIDLQTLSTLLGKNVVVSGTIHFTVEGTPLILEAAQITIAKGHDLEIWGRIPTPLHPPFNMNNFKAKRGLNAIVGKWPGDETDEEVIKALEELS
ncbi:DUF433 domain-containing protein [Candidatus Parabeggiatoa sp. HSG14]|uniref:DUF433 domain-containing protein n=1 Tax=Candidatus Parabeggiatoa sp. HSG14 TaxID=3055593 RepID=UPI0025A8D5D5|nr:DUF433 domain-containing protein [Thiotrichales bacterium HSG14]